MRSACITNPTQAGKFYISKDTFAHGTMSAMLNKRTEPRLRAYLKYHHTVGFEMGLADEAFKAMVVELIFKFIQMSPSGTSYECLESIGKEDPVQENEPLRVVNFRKLRNCCAIIIAIALLFLLIEIVKTILSSSKRSQP